MSEEQGKQEAKETKQRLGPELAIAAEFFAILVALESLLVAEGLLIVAVFLIVLTVSCVAIGIVLYWHRSANE